MLKLYEVLLISLCSIILAIMSWWWGERNPNDKKTSPYGDQQNARAEPARKDGRSTGSNSPASASDRGISLAPQPSASYMRTEEYPRNYTQLSPYQPSWTTTPTTQEQTRGWSYHHHQQEDQRQVKIQTLERQLAESSGNIKRLQEDLRRKEEETKTLATRLSEMASKNVSSANPRLEDLSTQNRSMVIAEKFEQDLYGNAWFEALESLLGTNRVKAEDDCTRLLLRILMEVYRMREDQLQKAIISANTFLSLDDDSNRTPWDSTHRRSGSNTDWLEKDINRLFASNIPLESTEATEHRRSGSNTDWLEKDIKRLFASNIPLESTEATENPPDYMEDILVRALSIPELQSKNWRGSDLLSSTPLANFVELCSNISRMMLVQDPPMVLKFDANEHDYVNVKLFVCYGRKGHRVDFLVWPALLLYDGGPVICKGTVKCK